jgi:malate permease and related proteins
LFSQVLSVTAPVFGIVLIGILYGRFSGINLDAANRINMSLFVPALLFYVLTEKIPDLSRMGDITVAAAIVILGSGLLTLPITRIMRLPERAILPSMMFNNSGNLGLPLAALAFGEQFLPLAVMAFVVSAGLNHSLGIWYVSQRMHPGEMLRNPVFLATLTGISFNLFGLHTPAMILPGLEMLSQVAIPLLLVALGTRLSQIDLAHWRLGLLIGLLCPAVGLMLAEVAILLLKLKPSEAQLILLFGALPPAVMNFLMAERYHQFPAQVASIVAIGNLLSVIVLPCLLVFIL